MQLINGRTLRIATLALTAAAIAAPVAATTPANAATTPSTMLSSNDHLVGGQKITVSGTGFAASASIGLIECSTPTPNPSLPQAGCDIDHAKLVTAAADGSFAATSFTISTGAVGTSGGYCPSKVAGGACYLIAADTADQTDATETALVFAPVISVTPATKVKSGQQLSVSGYGFPATKTAYVTECGNPPAATTCNGASNVQPVTDANGTFTTKITVTEGTFGTAKCLAGDTCLVTATTDIAETNLDQSTAAAFTFAAKAVTDKTKIIASGTTTRKHVAIRGVVEVKGAGVAGLKVTLFDRKKGTLRWHKVQGSKSGKHGVFAFTRLTKPRHKEQYQVRHPRQKIGLTTYAGSTSNTVTL